MQRTLPPAGRALPGRAGLLWPLTAAGRLWRAITIINC